MRFTFFRKIAIFLLYELTMLSPYISSWLPKIVGLPVGPILRGIGILLFYSAFLPKIILGKASVKISHSLFMFIVVFFILIVLSAVSGVSNLLQVMIGLHAFLFYPLTFLVIYITLNKSNQYERNKYISFIRRLIYANILIMASISIVDVISGGEFTLLLGYDPHYAGDGFSLINSYYDTIRANGGFADALAFGYLMATSIAFGFYMMTTTCNKWRYVLLILICGVALFMSITRGAILAGSIIIFIYTIRKIKNAVVLIFLLSLMLPLAPDKYIDIFAGRFSDSDAGSKQSTMLRYDMGIASLEYLANNPLGLGIGTQGGGNILSAKDNRINTDNFIFHALIELGILGGIVFYVIIFHQLGIVYRNTPLLPFFCMLIIFFICILLSSSMQSGILSITFWLVMSLFALDVERGKNVRIT